MQEEVTGKEQVLLDAALELFSEHGFDGTSVRMIAEKAGMNIAMISYYFGSKENLLQQLIDRKTLAMREHLASLAANEDMDDWEKFGALIDRYVDRITISGGKFHRLMMRELSIGARPEIARLIEDRITHNMKTLQGIITDGIRKKIFRHDIDFGMMMCMMIGTITQSIMSVNMFIRMDRSGSKKVMSEDERRKLVREHLRTVFARYMLVNPKKYNYK